jgi:hypothetical protein
VGEQHELPPCHQDRRRIQQCWELIENQHRAPHTIKKTLLDEPAAYEGPVFYSMALRRDGIHRTFQVQSRELRYSQEDGWIHYIRIGDREVVVAMYEGMSCCDQAGYDRGTPPKAKGCTWRTSHI